MKKSILCLVVALSASALFAQGPRGFEFGGRGMGMFAGPHALVTGAPYSAVEVVQTQETLADGNSITNQHQTTVYRDTSGRIRTEETIAPHGSGEQTYTVSTILDYVGGYRYVLDSRTMTAYQSPLRVPQSQAASSGTGRRNGGQANAAASNRPQVASTSLAPKVVNGVMASGTLHTETIPANKIGNAQAIQISRETWSSSELKVPVSIKSSDPRFGKTDVELTSIVQAEPSPALFVVPAGYTLKTNGRGPGGPMRGGRRGPGAQ
ncbi:MAG: hypothetical protein ABSB15_01410 [Bryobacteraceae bacterium]